MQEDKAFISTTLIPNDQVEMGRTICPRCGAAYILCQQLPFTDFSRVGWQIEKLRESLTDDHADPKFKAHRESYDLIVSAMA